MCTVGTFCHVHPQKAVPPSSRQLKNVRHQTTFGRTLHCTFRGRTRYVASGQPALGGPVHSVSIPETSTSTFSNEPVISYSVFPSTAKQQESIIKFFLSPWFTDRYQINSSPPSVVLSLGVPAVWTIEKELCLPVMYPSLAFL